MCRCGPQGAADRPAQAGGRGITQRGTSQGLASPSGLTAAGCEGKTKLLLPREGNKPASLLSRVLPEQERGSLRESPAGSTALSGTRPVCARLVLLPVSSTHAGDPARTRVHLRYGARARLFLPRPGKGAVPSACHPGALQREKLQVSVGRREAWTFSTHGCKTHFCLELLGTEQTQPRASRSLFCGLYGQG